MDISEISSVRSDAEFVRERLPIPDILEQLAEEAAELAQAANKLARIKRGINPTPVTEIEAAKNLIEELSDVALITELVLQINPDAAITRNKLQRWRERIENAK